MWALRAKNIAIWLVLACAWLFASLHIDAKFGSGSLALFTFGLVAFLALLQVAWKWHVKRQINKVSETDPRSIRIEGHQSQIERAVEIRRSLGWDSEITEPAIEEKTSLRFQAGLQATSNKELLKALYDEGLAWKIKP